MHVAFTFMVDAKWDINRVGSLGEGVQSAFGMKTLLHFWGKTWKLKYTALLLEILWVLPAPFLPAAVSHG